MPAQNFFQRLVVIALSVALFLPVSTLSSGKEKKKKEKETVPEGVPVLWREPSDITTRDLYWGPGGKELQPDLRKVTFISKEKGGYSTKYRVRDASGREWVAKLGKEAKGETAASRLMWATGYFADANYLVPKVRVGEISRSPHQTRCGGFTLR